MSLYPQPPAWVKTALHRGLVIPAHPLALTEERRLDEQRQRALTRYYHAAGAGGVAIGVHTTQFEIREHGLFEPVLRQAAQALEECDRLTQRQTVRVAGVVGPTAQATREAAQAQALGYHLGLLSLAALPEASDDELLAHCAAVAREIPLFGFYLQPAVGGRVLSREFWRRLADLPNLIAVKVAPFNRYLTLDVVQAVVESGRTDEIALYTGNDDSILGDLLTPFALGDSQTAPPKHFVGGLLGHWACWTQSAVSLLEQVRQARASGQVSLDLLALGMQITDCNRAFFDARHNFAGAIAGVHEVLHRQGLLANILCLDEAQRLSPGQAAEIDRVYAVYPHLADDDFVRTHLAEWLER